MKHSVLMMTATLAIAMAAGCSKVNDIPEVNEEAHEFTITASCGADSKVASAFGDDQNTINFTWSENDSIFVVFVPKDSLATMTEEKATSIKSYIFKLKSGAGTASAVFSCKNLTPSPMQPSITYNMYASYNPYIEEGDTMPKWHKCGENVFPYQIVEANQVFDPDQPLSNFAAQEAMSCRGVEVTSESSEPVVNFFQRLAALKVKVKNTGSEAVTISSFKYPASKRLLTAYPGHGLDWVYGGYHGQITCKTPITIEPGTTYPYYIAMPPQYYKTTHDYCYDFVFTLGNGATITVNKKPSSDIDFACGYMYSTTIALSASMATGGTIPPITGDDEDDF